MKKIDVIQLPYLYCSERSSGTKEKTMPTPILSVAARLLDAGLEINFFDENFEPYQYEGADLVLLNLHGSPYIPEIINFQKRILKVSKRDGKPVRFVLGGEIASRLMKDEFRRLFGDHTVNGNDDARLAEALGIPVQNLRPVEQVSMIPLYQKIPDRNMKHYLSQNISLFLAQGCKYTCKFCSARRTRRDPETGIMMKQQEQYKEIAIIERELEYLIGKARGFGLKKLTFYLSNLDMFQTPLALGEFARCALNIRQRYPDFGLDIRGLATVHGFLETVQNHPEVIDNLVIAGLRRVAFGVDGITPDVWKKIGKTHNFSGFKEDELDTKARKAIRTAKERGIITELLMLFGHNGADTEHTMEYAITFTKEMLREYGAIPRSFVAKDVVPGTESWYDPKHKSVVNTLIEHPELFQALDYLAIASPLTHPDESFRNLTNRYFLENATIGALTKGDKPLYATQLKSDGTGFEKFYGGFYERLRKLNPAEV